MHHIENQPSASFTVYIVNPIKKFVKNLFHIISYALARIAALFSHMMGWKSNKPVIIKDIRELELADLANRISENTDNFLIRQPKCMSFDIPLNKINFVYSLKHQLELIEEEEFNVFWKNHSLVIKKAVFTAIKNWGEIIDYPNPFFNRKFHKRALDEETSKQVNLILALNSKEMPELPNDIKRYIFGFNKSLLEKQEPEFAEAFYKIR